MHDVADGERPAARQLAAHCGTQHTELLIHPEPGEVLSAASRLYDEPFGDSSAAATWLCTGPASAQVTLKLAVRDLGGHVVERLFGPVSIDRWVAMGIPLPKTSTRPAGLTAAASRPSSTQPSAAGPNLLSSEARQKAEIIEETLTAFGVPAQVTEWHRGPVVTQFGIEPGFVEHADRDGEAYRLKVRVSKIISLF